MASFKDFLGNIANEGTPRGDVARDCLADPDFDGVDVGEYARDLPEFPAGVLRTMLAEWMKET